MRLLALLLALLSIALASGPAGAAEPIPGPSLASPIAPGDLATSARPALRIFRDRDGLPENAPIALALDPRGVLWTGTEDGLAAYDGRKFETYNAPKREVSNYFRAVYPDARGRIWCGLQDGGLARLFAGRWTTFEGAGLPSERVDAITEAVGPAGRTIWVGTPQGLAREDGDHWTVLGEKDGLPSARVTALLDGHDPAGAPALYVGTAGGLAISHGRDFALVAGAPVGQVYALYESSDPPRELWVAVRDRGLARYAGGAWTHFGKADGVPEEHIRSITQTTAPDRAQTRTTWFSANTGLFRFDGARFTSFVPDALPSPMVWSLLPEPLHGPTHTLWIGVDGGLVRVRLGGFRTFAGEPATKSTYGIQVTHEGGREVLWLGTRGGGLQRFDGAHWTSAGDGPASDPVYAVTEVDEGAGKHVVWAGTSDGELWSYEAGAWSIALNGIGTVRQLHAFAGDDAAPVLDVVSGTQGVLRRVHGQWSHIDVAAGLPTNEVFDVAETRADPAAPSVLWVATDGAGLVRREGSGPWTRFDRKSSALLSDSVLAVHVVRDERGRDLALWAGTQGGGASYLDLRDPNARFVTLTERSVPPLPNDTVYAVQDDRHGRVFLVTNKGVARLTPRAPTAADPAPFIVRTFTTEDGLPANEGNSGGAFVDDRGRLWAGTISGVAFLDEAEEVSDDVVPAIDLTPRLARLGTPLLPGALLPYDQSGVVFEYVLPRLFRGAETQYRTQLEGLESSAGAWTLDARHEYPALPEGAYVFRVWARDFAGGEAGPVAIPFRVRPPPWSTWWAMVSYALSLAGIIYAIGRYRVFALERRNALLEAGIAERTDALAKKVDELAVSESRARAAEEDARRADRAKSLFLSTMSHELRTPLNAILGFSQLLVRDHALSHAHHEDVEVIQRSGEHLLGLINDVLSIAKIEAGMVVLENRTFRLEDVVAGATKIVGSRARAKGLRLSTELAPDLPAAVRGDEGKVRQILLNLLGNAVKFTVRGGVTVRVAWESGRAVFEVEDTGPGIAAAELATLFSPFVQSEVGRSASEGTGLGLAISRSYAQRMGGDVSATSTLGVGTTFRCALALETADGAEAPPIDLAVTGLAPGSGPFRVLAVDDSPENRRLLVRLLAMEGLEVKEAATGEEAVRLAETFAPDLVFMDVHMPGISGGAATEAIRADERKSGRRRTKIVALSASALETDREALLQGGCDAFVSKPFREAVLFETIESLVGARFQRAGDSGSVRPDADAATPERLRRIPEPLRRRLYLAARNGDLGGARDAVDQVAQTDRLLADSLRVLVDAFLLEEIEARMSADATRSDRP